MACATSYEVHHNFPKLAEEAGFSFNLHKPRVHIEWNKIKLINIESLIRERKFVTIEQHINDVLHCVLESEFDVRILDEGVLKIFRLAQLAVEYQEFCRHYLDRSVHVLREEVNSLLKELDTTRKLLREKEEDIRRLKRKSKHYPRTALPYGNENIATMLLKTLNQNKSDIFNRTQETGIINYNKCSYCEKVFLNQLYLNGHILRRHPNSVEIPQKDLKENETSKEDINLKFNEEIAELKSKLKQMEDLIVKPQNSNNQIQPTSNTNSPNKDKIETNEISPKEMKDAEVLTSEDGYMMDKIEEWKKQEYEKYNKEINLLRNQIVEIISNKEKQDQSTGLSDSKIMEQLQTTIKRQGDEIEALKQELSKEETNEKVKRKEIETQMAYWIQQTEKQSAEYKALLQKLNNVTSEAEKFKAKADAEQEKSKMLQELLQQQLKQPSPKPSPTITKNTNKPEPVQSVEVVKSVKEEMNKTLNQNKKPTADLMTLQKLQQKAHELLYFDQSTTDSSSTSDDKVKTQPNQKQLKKYSKENTENYGMNTQPNKLKSKTNTNISNYDDNDGSTETTKSKKKSKHKLKTEKRTKSKNENGYAHIPGSPIKVVRAKITEEVNLRLTSLGIDPLKNRLQANIFQKQRMILQKQQETKTKKFPVREKVLHSIMSNLDENTSCKKNTLKAVFISPNKSPKTFSISSVIANVKTKALSKFKSNESINKSENSYNDVARRAMSLLKTPPGSAHSSPKTPERHSAYSPYKDNKEKLKTRKNGKYQPQATKSEVLEIHQMKENDTNDESDTSSDGDLTFDQTNKINKDDPLKSPILHPKDSSRTKNSLFLEQKQNIKDDTTYQLNVKEIILNKENNIENTEDTSDGVESIEVSPKKIYYSEENLSSQTSKQTKGVLKNASSTSSLNKKKVLFDMDAIQMKSISASPSQSTTEKSDYNDQLKPSTVNLDLEEWDISSIEAEPTTAASKIHVNSHTSPKIAELKKTIESQLNRRNPGLPMPVFGGVDVLAAPIQKGSNFGGSNTSLGSSILDETDNSPMQNNAVLIKSKATEKEDSEIEISDLINDAVDSKNYIKSF